MTASEEKGRRREIWGGSQNVQGAPFYGNAVVWRIQSGSTISRPSKKKSHGGELSGRMSTPMPSASTVLVQHEQTSSRANYRVIYPKKQNQWPSLFVSHLTNQSSPADFFTRFALKSSASRRKQPPLLLEEVYNSLSPVDPEGMQESSFDVLPIDKPRRSRTKDNGSNDSLSLT